MMAIASVASVACSTLLGIDDDEYADHDANVDGRSDDGTTGADAGSDTANRDAASSDADAASTDADTGTGCVSSPTLFQPVPLYGPFCPGTGVFNNHCYLGWHCCHAPSGVATCAQSCGGDGSIDIECFSEAECEGGTCCGTGTLDKQSCSYPRVTGFTGSKCKSFCTQQQCAGDSECILGGTCTPARVADSGIQIGLCTYN